MNVATVLTRGFEMLEIFRRFLFCLQDCRTFRNFLQLVFQIPYLSRRFDEHLLKFHEIPRTVVENIITAGVC